MVEVERAGRVRAVDGAVTARRGRLLRQAREDAVGELGDAAEWVRDEV